MMVVITLKVLFSPASRIRGLEILRAVVGPLQGEPGFVRFNLSQAIDDENAVTFEEVWNSQADLDRRISSEQYRHILAVMDLSLEPPEIDFRTVSPGSGMEKIKLLREEVGK
jgi:quinol monooxygenase YgiN